MPRFFLSFVLINVFDMKGLYTILLSLLPMLAQADTLVTYPAPGRGIENVLFRRIAYHGKVPNMSIITGYDDQRLVKNVIFDGLMINGPHISDDMQGKPKWYKTADIANIFVGEHVEGLSFQ